MNLNFYTLCVIYLVYSFLGWVGETVVATAKGRRFTNRGVASGPFCFVYGTAGVLITIGLNDQRTSLAALFFGSMIYATVVEWLTAKLLERIHHRRWWDYSDKKFNLDGYVCLQYSLLWGLLGMAAVRWGNDLLFRLCAHLPPLLFHAVVWVGMALAVLDQISAMVVVSRYANRHPRLEQLNRWELILLFFFLRIIGANSSVKLFRNFIAGLLTVVFFAFEKCFFDDVLSFGIRLNLCLFSLRS